MKFYSQYHATRFVMPKGKICQFAGGIYETEDKDEISEMKQAAEMCQEVFGLTPRALIKNDAYVLREVGKATGTGAVNSQLLSQISAGSN